MKKITLLLLASLILLTGCGGNKDKDKPEVTDVPTVVTPENDKVLPDPLPMVEENKDDVPLTDEEVKHESVAEKYPTIDLDNVVVDATAEEVSNLMEKGTGAIYFATPRDDWSQFLMYEVNLACKAAGVEVKLFDLTMNLKEENNSFVNEIKNFLQLEDSKELQMPTVVFVKEGKLQGYYTPEVDMNSTSPQHYYNSDKTIEVEDQLYQLANSLN